MNVKSAEDFLEGEDTTAAMELFKLLEGGVAGLLARSRLSRIAMFGERKIFRAAALQSEDKAQQLSEIIGEKNRILALPNDSFLLEDESRIPLHMIGVESTGASFTTALYFLPRADKDLRLLATQATPRQGRLQHTPPPHD